MRLQTIISLSILAGCAPKHPSNAQFSIPDSPIKWEAAMFGPQTACPGIDNVTVYAVLGTPCPALSMVDDAIKHDLRVIRTINGHKSALGHWKLVYTTHFLLADDGKLLVGITPLDLYTSIVSMAGEGRGQSTIQVTQHELCHAILYIGGFDNDLNINHQPPELWEACEKTELE